MTVSATTSTARGRAVPADRDGGAPAACGVGRARRPAPAAAAMPRRASSAGRPTSTRVAVDDALHAEPLDVARSSSTAGSAPDPLARRRRDGPRDRVLGGGLERAGQPQRLVASSPSAGVRRRPASSGPSVTVPVLSSTTVSTRRVDSSTSGPLIRMPSWAPRPVPTSSAVGVASPSAHGQAMISTATAAVKAAAAPAPVPSQNAEGGRRPARSRSARRRRRSGRPAAAPAALPFCASSTSRAIWASWVSAPTRVARTTSRPPALTVAPTTASPGPTSTGTDSPVSMRGVDGGAALLDDAVGGDLLARAARRTGRRRRAASTGIRTLARRRGSTRDVLGAELEQRPQRGPGAPLGPGLEVPAGEQERGDAGRGLEVDVARRRRRARWSARTGASCPASPAVPKNSAYSDQPNAASVPSETSVSMVAAPWRRLVQAARWNGQRRPTPRPARRASSESHCQ